MSLTVAALEAEIVDRIGPKLIYVGMPIATEGTNSSLRGPIRRALKEMGWPTASPLSVADSDLAAFLPADSTTPAYDAWRVERLADLAVLQALRSVLGKTTDVDYQAGIDREYLSQFAAQVRQEIADLEATVEKPYGANLPAAVLGSMNAAPIPNDPFDPCNSRSAAGHWPYP